ncbi:MAG: sialate O-acetylesterase [Chitinophagaceae bacterium]
MKYTLLVFFGVISFSFIGTVKTGSLLKNKEKKFHTSISFGNGINISIPVSRIVYQRDNKDNAIIQIRGEVEDNVSSMEARLIARKKGEGTNTKWKRIAKNIPAGDFSGLLTGKAGWYNLEVRAKKGKRILYTTVVERVGIGEVFVVAGHSVAQGGDINIEGATDDRVSTIAVHEKSEVFQKYLETGDPQYLPEPKFVQAASGVAQAPFGHDNYFWSKFAELLARKENVPVLIYNAAFGGTNLVHWAKATKGIQFEHSFVKSKIRMPYINLLNTFKKYIPLTGLRAILADHGQNDAGEKNADIIFDNYKIFIRQAREDLQYPELALVVNRQTPKDAPAVRIAQERMIKEPYSFAGPDYDRLLPEDHVDGIHLNASGEEKAAVMWANALTPEFFKASVPWLPSWK